MVDVKRGGERWREGVRESGNNMVITPTLIADRVSSKDGLIGCINNKMMQ